MPTIARGNTAEIYCPLATSVTFTPGSGGAVRVSVSAQSGDPAIAPQFIQSATAVAVTAGSKVFAEAITADASYTTPAGGDTAVSSLVSGDVSPFYQFFVPTLQQIGSGSAKDLSGRGNNFVLGSALADNGSGVWSDTSREINAFAKIADATATAGYMYCPSLTSPWSLTEWFIFAAIIKPTVAPQARTMFSCEASGGASPGWNLRGDASGKLAVIIRADSPTSAQVNIASTPTLLTSGKTSHITVVCDPVNKDVFLYVNGVLADSWLASWTGTGTSILNFATAAFGVTSAGASADQYGCNWGAMHYLKGTGAVPSNHAAIAQRLAAAPFLALSPHEVRT